MSDSGTLGKTNIYCRSIPTINNLTTLSNEEKDREKDETP